MSTPTSGDPNGAVLSDKKSNGAVEKRTPITTTFPTGFEVLFQISSWFIHIRLSNFVIHQCRTNQY